MSRTAIGLAALFLGLALFQGARGFFASDPAPPPPPPESETTVTPTPSPEPSLSAPEDEEEKLEPFPTFEGPRPKAKSYASTEELTAAMKERGVECTSLEFLEESDPTLDEFSLCDVGSANRRYNIYFFPAEPNRQLYLNNMKAQKLPLPLVYGPNWIVVAAGERKTALKRTEALAGAIGGRIRDFSGKKKT